MKTEATRSSTGTARTTPPPTPPAQAEKPEESSPPQPPKDTAEVTDDAGQADDGDETVSSLVSGLQNNFGSSDREAPRDKPMMSVAEAERRQLHNDSESAEPDGSQGGKSIGEAINSQEQRQSDNEDAVAGALEGGDEPSQIVNGNGDTADFTAQQVEGSDSHNAYEVQVGEDTVRVEVPPGEDPNAVIAEVLDYYSQQPEDLRDAVDTVRIEAGRNPADDYWAEEYDQPGFTSAATGGDGTITFWNGSQYLSEDVFDHEFGHNVGDQVEDQQDSFWDKIREGIGGDGPNVPDGWEDAIEEDGASVSDYGDNAPTEDFAESYQQYQEAMEEGPEAVEEWREAYPERAAILDEIYGVAA